MLYTIERVAGMWPAGPTITEREEMRAEGWRVVGGVVAPGGYRPAREGGGYVATVTPAQVVVPVARGTPGYHGEVALPPQ